MTKRLIVIHTAECGETANADAGIEGTLRARNIPVTRIVDADSDRQMLDIHADCWAARGLNGADGIHYEHAGFARQTPAEWSDPYSSAELARSALLAARDAIALGIPPVHLTGDAVKTGRGFCGHVDISNAFNVAGGHWDPGPSFPWDHYLSMVALNMIALGAGVPAAPAPVPAPTPATPPPVLSTPAGVSLVDALKFGLMVAKGKTLRQGDTGDAVKFLQGGLVKLGYWLTADGVFGVNTRVFLIDFQKHHGLAPDGICGPATWAALWP